MMLVGYTMNQYMLCFIITFFLIIIDAVMTNINSRVYQNYYLVEFIPWNRVIYKYIPGVGALFVSLICNVGIFFGLMMLPISISNFVIILGFMLYRSLHSIFRAVNYWRLSNGK